MKVYTSWIEGGAANNLVDLEVPLVSSIWRCILLVVGGVIDLDDLEASWKTIRFWMYSSRCWRRQGSWWPGSFLEDHKILDANLVIEQICICKSHRGWSHERFCFSNEGVFFLAPRELLLEEESFLEDQKVFGADLDVVHVSSVLTPMQVS